MKKIDYNKRMLGKSVLVKTEAGDQRVEVVRVIDEEHFEVSPEGEGQKFLVSIHDLRSIENEPA
jgi:hypothetical protein|tara:strand:- start:3280 stop:3471 length:192 start_codon:yes stop_codon:yes gene_type:complete